MAMKLNKQLPLPADLKAEYPLSREVTGVKARRDAEIRDIFTGRSDKFVVIVGPCSADNEDSVCDYVSRLAALNDRLSDRLMLIPRIYTNKPRTTGEGAFRDVYSVMANMGANHGAFTYGHIGADILTLASMLRIPVYAHNIPDDQIYRPSAWGLHGTADPEGADFRACANYGPLYGKY